MQDQRARDRINAYIHGAVIMAVLVSATILRVRNELDTATISTVYGAIIGYATGLTTHRSSGQEPG